MLKKKRPRASGKLVLVKSACRHWTSGDVRLVPTGSGTETAHHRMKFCVQRDLGDVSTSTERKKITKDFAFWVGLYVANTQALLAEFNIFLE